MPVAAAAATSGAVKGEPQTTAFPAEAGAEPVPRMCSRPLRISVSWAAVAERRAITQPPNFVGYSGSPFYNASLNVATGSAGALGFSAAGGSGEVFIRYTAAPNRAVSLWRVWASSDLASPPFAGDGRAIAA